MKPSCNRCVTGLYKCVYSITPPPTTELLGDDLFLSSSPRSFFTASPSTSEASFSLDTSSPPTTALCQTTCCENYLETQGEISETELYHHYLHHTSHTLTHLHRDQSALQIGIPTLALRSKTVYHSLLAVSAACLGIDLIAKEIPPSIDTVQKILRTGYQHYSLASEQMRESISQPDTLQIETLLASTVLLVPWATASQQLYHWISTRSGVQGSHIPLSTTPRDVIIIMRGIRTTIESLENDNVIPDHFQSLRTGSMIDSSPAVEEAEPLNLASSRNHVMFPIVTATSQRSFSKLQNNIESTLLCQNGRPNDNLSACITAFGVLNQIRTNAFSKPSQASSFSTDSLVEKTLEPNSIAASHIPQWLRSLVIKSAIPQPTEPLTPFFLTFLVQTPQRYLDLVLPLLDQRLESPVKAASDGAHLELTMEQALALDIYAHWSVLMLMVEKESWWIRNLPVVTLSGMVNRYGNKFVSKLWPELDSGLEEWWPGSMLSILQEIRCYQ
jgi:hypothetical protein